MQNNIATNLLLQQITAGELAKACEKELHRVKYEVAQAKRMSKQPIDVVFIHPKNFDFWKIGIISLHPQLEGLFDDEIQFNDCRVRKGSKVMVRPVEVIYKKDKPNIEA
jgi:hypothetical protein